MNVVILGSGRVGAGVAGALSPENRVAIIDRKKSAFERLPAGFQGETVLGNGIDTDVQVSAGVAEADIFVALTDDDDRNLMAAQIARHLGATKAVARVYDPVRAELYGSMGLVTLSPTVQGAQRIFDMLERASNPAPAAVGMEKP